MTVCIGALFRWNYAPPGQPPIFGGGGLAISDRMITAGKGDIEYEPNQQKMADLTPRIVLLIAGDYTVHSQALKAIMAQTRNNPSLTPYNAAMMYGAAIQEIQRKAAEDLFLAPLGLNTDSFLAQQREMSPSFVAALTDQLQSYEGADVAALVVGTTDDAAHLYEVDHRGRVRCYDDVGFAVIGIGASHATSVMTQSKYVNAWDFAPALSVAFAAKKAAETAPGVGETTDIRLILRGGNAPLDASIALRLEAIYKEYAEKRFAAALAAIQKLREPPDASTAQGTPPQGEEPPGTNPGGNSDTPGSSDTESASDATKTPE